MGAIVFFDVLMTSVYLYCILYYKAAVFNNVLLYLPMCFECLFLCCGEQIPTFSKGAEKLALGLQKLFIVSNSEAAMKIKVAAIGWLLWHFHFEIMYYSCIDQLVFLLQWWFCCSAAVSQFNFAKVQYLSFSRGWFLFFCLFFLFGWIAVTSLAFLFCRNDRVFTILHQWLLSYN